MQRTGNRNERNKGENLRIGVELMSYNKNKRKAHIHKNIVLTLWYENYLSTDFCFHKYYFILKT